MTKQQTKVSIYNYVGKKVLEQEIVGNTQLNLTELSSGVYYMKWNENNHEKTTKLVLVK